MKARARFFAIGCFCALALVAVPCEPASGSTFQAQPFFLSAPGQATLLVNKGQAASSAKLLAFIDSEELETTFVTALPRHFDSSTHVVILFPGVGGNVVRWGATSESTMTLGNALVKKGVYPVFLEHPVYYRARQEGYDSERKRLAEKYTPLPFQLEHFTASLEKILNKIPRNAQGQLSKKVWLMGRSNGTNRIMEWLHRLDSLDEKAQRLSQVLSGVLISGIVSPDRNRSFLWQSAEDLEAERDPGEADRIALGLDHATAAQLRWASKQRTLPENPLPLPRIVAIASKQDAYYPLELQVEAVQTFFRNHPTASIDLLLAPCRHDPSASFCLNGGKTVRQGVLIKDVLETFILQSAPSAGIRTRELPHYSDVEPCAEVLTKFESIKAKLAPLVEYP